VGVEELRSAILAVDAIDAVLAGSAVNAGSAVSAVIAVLTGLAVRTVGTIDAILPGRAGQTHVTVVARTASERQRAGHQAGYQQLKPSSSFSHPFVSFVLLGSVFAGTIPAAPLTKTVFYFLPTAISSYLPTGSNSPADEDAFSEAIAVPVFHGRVGRNQFPINSSFHEFSASLAAQSFPNSPA
jgi:hypothetical protein